MSFWGANDFFSKFTMGKYDFFLKFALQNNDFFRERNHYESRLHKLIEKRTRLIEGRIKARQAQEAVFEATK